MGSLGDSMAYNEWALMWSFIFTCASGWPPEVHSRGGRCHSLAYETYGMKFWNQSWIFQRHIK